MSLRAVTFALSALIAASTLSGCATSGGIGSGGLFSSRKPGVDYIAALQGGIVGRLPAEISKSDRQRALEAEYRALEQGEVGQSVAWKGRGASGTVVAAAPYQVGSQNCRQYTHTVTSEDGEVSARGAACRNADGTWTPLL
ncbi:Surface antigen [Rhizobium sp. RU35A]|uniref:Surface antigen domain-containing protein n=1 Tax=Rhizobium straminoryzae TaxID=1387186 RepID=A0A549SM22_9HYPH|nr:MULTISPECIES: RT0821/Lpp0805 family surface protein [Rhizobium]TRL30683.1 hypothetical protein FNA46_25180 [Rhizobium straminoryzae]SIP94015.1 Surface antigen [Rhizobium sp. RU35A]